MIYQGIVLLSILLALSIALVIVLRQYADEIKSIELEDKLKKQQYENKQLKDIIENRRVNVEFKVIGGEIND